jgi:hypothetical protein
MEVTRALARFVVGHQMLNTCKPFACGIVIHPAIDGCIRLRNEHDGQLEAKFRGLA